MSFRISHTLLVSGEDFEHCKKRVVHFFKQSQLVRYDEIKVISEQSCCALAAAFQPLLENSLQKNHNKLQALLKELHDCGYATLADLMHLPQGYHSKILHTIAHMEDGFFGIDARFFDIDESSYQLSQQRLETIATHPETCWLLTIEAATMDSGNGFEQS